MSNKRNLSISPTTARYLRDLIEDDLDQTEDLTESERRAAQTVLRRLEKMEETWD
jgi:predicted DNA-binding protein